MGASSLAGVCELLSTSFHSVCKDWDTEEKASFKAQLLHFSEPVARGYYCGDGISNEPDGVGIPMRAIVAIARK